MTESLRSYGFDYECDGRHYAFHVMADSPDDAKRRVVLMATAGFVGELKLDEWTQKNASS